MGLSLTSILGNPLGKMSVDLADMGGLVEKQLGDAILCFERRDVDMARNVVALDREVNEREHLLGRAVQEALQHKRVPADQVGQALAILQDASDLERVGDLAKNIAKRSLVLSGEDQSTALSSAHTTAQSSVVRMGRIASRQLADVLDAMARHDPEAAAAVWMADEEIDELYHSVFREILLVMAAEPKQVNASTHLVFVAKNFERVGDHATNLAERVYFTATGKRLEDLGPRRENPPIISDGQNHRAPGDKDDG